MRLTVRAELQIYEISGDDAHGNAPELVVESHWNRSSVNGLIVLKLPKALLERADEDGDLVITVGTDALGQAIKSCSGF